MREHLGILMLLIAMAFGFVGSWWALLGTCGCTLGGAYLLDPNTYFVRWMRGRRAKWSASDSA
jgi:hypothetical protein